jgi:cell wall-associated NlpC family hydrolase
MSNAAVIVAVGKQMGVPEPGWVVAVAAALQESGLRNLNYGDRDSLGLFQQRPSMGWGTREHITIPSYAATKFFERLQATPNWQRMSVTDAAQTVQRSGFPHAYAKQEGTARAIVAAVSGVRCKPAPTGTGTGAGAGNCDTIQTASPTAMTAINWACGQQGVPYLWGGNGPETRGKGGFDCSGLTKAAYAAAGIQIPRTAQTQYDAGPRLPAGQPVLPGDLVFFGSGPTAVTHVGIAISGKEMIDAPETGATVRTEPIWWSTFVGATRPATMRSG